jgi:hypothetical protein
MSSEWIGFLVVKHAGWLRMAGAQRRQPPRRYGGERSRRYDDRIEPRREAASARMTC